MNQDECAQLRAALEEMRGKLVASARAAASGGVHLDPDDFPDEIDSASLDTALAFVGRLREREQVLLRKIDAALERIDQGSIGECLSCGDPIGIERMRARPVATLCIECKSEQEAHEG